MGNRLSAIGFWNWPAPRGVPYVVGLPPAARKLLPDWIGHCERLEDVPPKATVLLDEAYMQYHSRNSMSSAGLEISRLVNLSRQKQQTLIFITQEGRQLDVNVIAQADVIAIKELSEISKEFERKELRQFTDKARAAFATVQGDRRPWTWIFSETAGEVGLVENQLPSFWSPRLSRAFATANSDHPSGQLGHHRGAKPTREELMARAVDLRNQGHSFRAIGEILGIPTTTAFDLVKEARS